MHLDGCHHSSSSICKLRVLTAEHCRSTPVSAALLLTLVKCHDERLPGLESMVIHM